MNDELMEEEEIELMKSTVEGSNNHSLDSDSSLDREKEWEMLLLKLVFALVLRRVQRCMQRKVKRVVLIVRVSGLRERGSRFEEREGGGWR